MHRHDMNCSRTSRKKRQLDMIVNPFDDDHDDHDHDDELLDPKSHDNRKLKKKRNTTLYGLWSDMYCPLNKV
jgi:hypothetical protein